MTSTVQVPALDAQADGVQQIQDVPLWTESFHGSGLGIGDVPGGGAGTVELVRACGDP